MNNVRNITALPIWAAEKLRKDNNTAIISIIEPGKYVNLDTFDHILRLYLHDVEPDDQNITMYKLFDSDQAKDIVSFIKGLPDSINHLIVHCHAGVSRSAAVALAISDYYGLNFNTISHPSYNRYIYKVITDYLYYNCDI